MWTTGELAALAGAAPACARTRASTIPSLAASSTLVATTQMSRCDPRSIQHVMLLPPLEIPASRASGGAASQPEASSWNEITAAALADVTGIT
jgi:hypothetical protein